MHKNRKPFWAMAFAASAFACGAQPETTRGVGVSQLEHSFTGSLSASGTSWRSHRFDVTEAGALTGTLDWADSGANLNLFLYDPAGELVTYANGSTARPERVSFEIVTPGSYSLGVKAASGSTSYDLTAVITPAVSGDTFTGSLSSSGTSWTTHDFSAEPGEDLTIRLDWDNASADFNVFLEDPTGTQVAYANGTTARPEVVTHAPTTSGTYQVGIKCKSGSGNYTLRIERDEPGGTPEVETLFGASFEPGKGTEAFEELDGLLGGMDVRRSFSSLGEGIDEFLTRYQEEDIEFGVVSAYSFKYQPRDVIAGRHDADLRRFFAGIADGHTVYWTYWHEPDDELYVDHTFTPADYRAAWRHIRQIADAEKAERPALQAFATLIIMEWSMTDSVRDERPLLGDDGMYPGDDVIDVFGVDTYNYASVAKKGKITDVPDLYGKLIDFAKEHGKPWAIGEIGSCPVADNPNGRATFLRDSIEYWIERDYPPLYAAYFNLDWSSCDYRLESQPPALEVWRTACTEGLDGFR